MNLRRKQRAQTPASQPVTDLTPDEQQLIEAYRARNMRVVMRLMLRKVEQSTGVKRA